jgi:hypothetical protein
MPGAKGAYKRETEMRKLFAIAGILLATVASAYAEMTAADIAALPQDKVRAIKASCAQQWNDNFRMREFCEDKQYEALKRLIERGSIKPNGEKM